MSINIISRMKTKRIYSAVVIVFFISSCQFVKNKTQEGVNSTLESVIESQTGQDIDLAELDSYQDQKVEANFEYDGKELLNENVNFSGSILISKSPEELNISFQLVDESGISLMGVFSNFTEDFKLPLVGKFSPSNTPTEGFATATLILTKVSETGMEELPMPFEGSMTMLSINEKEAEFEVNARGGTSQNTNDPTLWKNIKCKVKISNPIYQSIGIKKEQIFK
ncbi:hypothetical protein SAMN06298216_1520 [Spirosomataceae bacterium TFI 002]|nr:hypothetical protein SAMN06298216_1520 [Spirosomataceae bacterium TFI 002]